MFNTAVVTYFHFFGIFVLLSSLVVELVLFKKDIHVKDAKTILQADVFYGLASILIMATGLLKMFVFGKGSAYYLHNHILWTKLMLFAIVGVLSIYPTIYFFKWRKVLKESSEIIVPQQKFIVIKRIIIIEIVIVFCIPFLATLMARGFGYVPD